MDTLIAYGGPIAFVLFLWWFGTGAVLLADRLPSERRRRAFMGASAAAVVALFALYALRDQTDVAGAYAGFAAGLALWAWHEFAFLIGLLTGPRRTPCPAGAVGWRRFRLAAETVIHHEIAMAATIALMIVIGWGGANQTGLATFSVLWAMRLSAKLNLFLGVANLVEAMTPRRLAYLQSYFRKRPMNPLFPISATFGIAAAAIVIAGAATAPMGGYAQTAGIMVGVILALGVLEHWFLVLPMREEALWRWALRPSSADPAAAEAEIESRADRPRAPALDFRRTATFDLTP